MLEGILRESLHDVPDDVTIAAGIAENASGKLIAWSGNARFKYAGNWTDCGLAPRSPGSALKPLAYLSAIEQGILTPSTLIADTSSGFAGRAPRNFDQTYRGAVTARTALHTSLNAPAARVLRQAGNPRVMSLLRNAGFNHLTHDTDYYGDSLILGGCEVTLLELLEAYTAIASLGVHRKLRVLEDEEAIPTRIASEAGCWMISEMLKHDNPLETGGMNVAVKTGTSYGLRDAWACAWTPGYTVCVWCGKEDGSSWDGLVGARVCTPVALRIHRILPRSGWYERPKDVIARKVCALSGKPPTALCPSVKLDWAISGVSQTLPCDIHGVNSTVNMPHEFGTNTGRNARFSIISPIPGASYFTAPLDDERKIPFKAEASRGNVHWYVDGEYVGMSMPGMTCFHDIADGEHTVSGIDDDGHTDAVRVKVFTPGKIRQDEKLF